nr:zinc knuckle CX2CX4HX4C [Tanacetum cinerariifolium]
GRVSFARCLIEVRADATLKDSVIVGIPLHDGEGFTKEMVQVEYEWKPPYCDHYKIFGHVYDQCPKNPIKQKVTYEPKTHGNLPKNKAPKVSSSAKDDPTKKLPTTKGGLHVPTSKPSAPTSR